MDMELKQQFAERWERYFDGADLPITFYYTDRENAAEPATVPSGHQCVIGSLARVRKGRSLRFDVDSVGCFGGKRYFGFTETAMPKLDYFLSCGIPGEMEGERYKKTPEIARAAIEAMPEFSAPARYIVFKRWDMLEEADEPAVVIFFAPPDVLSGLFTLAGFDEADANAVVAPFCAGCGSIVQHPYLEKDAEHPRAVVGMFDVSARPFVPAGVLSFAVPMAKFARMVANMPDSFLITPSWQKVHKRIARE